MEILVMIDGESDSLRGLLIAVEEDDFGFRAGFPDSWSSSPERLSGCLRHESPQGYDCIFDLKNRELIKLHSIHIK
jgi:hypothetical protein